MKKITTLLIACILLISCANYGEKKVYNGTEVYYKEGVTEAQADKLGESLISSGFSNGDVKSVQFLKDGEQYIFKMVVEEKTLDDATLKNVFNLFPRELSDLMGLPIDLHLCDNTFNTLRVHKYEDAQKAIMAKATEVRYTKNVTLEEAEKLKSFLLDSGFSDDDTPKTVELDKENDTYMFKMVISKDKLNNESTVTLLKLFGSQIAKEVFDNKPLKVHMCDDLMNTIKIAE